MTSPRQFTVAAKAMTAAVRASGAAAAALEKHCPAVFAEIVTDAASPDLFSLWGRSFNFDENAGKTIVAPEIVAAVGRLAGVPMRGRAVHAGLLHTYGYLFSSIKTPYGLKRDRWLSQSLEQGLGLEESLLSDRPHSGTLLGNATWLFGQIAFHGHPAALRRLKSCGASVAAELRDRDFTNKQNLRIVEETTTRNTSRRTIRSEVVRFITDLVPYRRKPASPTADDTLLVYSVQIGRVAPQLITGFPIKPTAARALREAVDEPAPVAIRPRYNAAVPGFKSPRPGRRYLAEF